MVDWWPGRLQFGKLVFRAPFEVGVLPLKQHRHGSREPVRCEGKASRMPLAHSHPATRNPPLQRRALTAYLAPSPVGNSHPECYRTYEALQAGALPLVDTDYYWVVFRAPFFQVNSDWDMSHIVDMISAPGGWELLETYRLRSTPLFSLASFSLSLSRTWPVRALT